MNRLAGKVALITGASSGLGRVGAERFAAEGAQVVIADMADGDEAVEAIAAAGGEASYVRCDVTDEQSIESAVQHAVETFGGLHVLYNNAGVMLGDDDNPVTTSVETYQKTMDINVLGVLLGCKYAIPAMQESAEQAGESGVDHQRRVVRRPHGCGHAAGRVHRVEGRCAGDDPRDRRDLRASGHPRQRAVPRPDHDAVAGQVPVRRRQAQPPPGAHPDGPLRRADRDRQRCAVPGQSNESSWMTGQSLIIDGGITAAYVTPE